MKHIVLAIVVLFSITPCAFAAGTWTTVSWDEYLHEDIRVARATFTADASNASIPTLTFKDSDFNYIKGYSLCYVGHDPGSTGPTNGAWDITVPGATTSDSDLSGGAAVNLSSTVGGTFWTKDTGGTVGCRPIREKPTVVITGNAVNSATATVYLWFYKP